MTAPAVAGASQSSSRCPVIVIGCGKPLNSVGWWHIMHMLNDDWRSNASEGRQRGSLCPSADLTAVVSRSWTHGVFDGTLVADASRQAVDRSGVNFFASLSDIPPAMMKRNSDKLLAVIACRTRDCPRQFREAIELAGATHIFLEKPGAPTLAELEDMQALAKAHGVPVYMGFNKNVTKYVREALAFASGGGDDKHLITFVHNNTYTPETLAECFEMNSEGMFKNMAVHEIALLVSYFGVTRDNIAEVLVDRDFSECLTLGDHTDFSRVGFTIVTTDGRRAAIKADRCGGILAMATVENTASGDEVFRSVCPDEELNAKVEEGLTQHPETKPYLLANDDDYIALKERICAHVVSGAKGDPEGIATLAVAIETMRVAEFLTERIQKELGAVEPCPRCLVVDQVDQFAASAAPLTAC